MIASESFKKTLLLAISATTLSVFVGCSDDSTTSGSTTTGAGASGGHGGMAATASGGAGGTTTTAQGGAGGAGGAADGGAGPGGAGQGGAGQGGAGGGMMMCPPEPGDDACVTCMKTNCCQESLDCLDDTECSACLTCLDAAMNQQEQFACFASNTCDPRDPETSAFLGCGNTNCATECQQ